MNRTWLGRLPKFHQCATIYAHHIAREPAFILLLDLGDFGRGQVGEPIHSSLS
jgi:hypothetical protein